MNGSPQFRIVKFFAVAALVAASSPAIAQPGVNDVVIVLPEPTEELFVDPVRDTLDPSLVAINPRAAEIQPWRLDVRPAEAALSASRSRLRVGDLDPEPNVFLDPAGRENELTGVERVATSGREIVVGRLSRRASSARLAATRRARFGRPDVPRPRPALDPARPYGPRP